MLPGCLFLLRKLLGGNKAQTKNGSLKNAGRLENSIVLLLMIKIDFLKKATEERSLRFIKTTHKNVQHDQEKVLVNSDTFPV